MAIQAQLGSDIAMALDVCPPIDAPLEAQREATEITHRWAVRSLSAPAGVNQARFPIVQGGCDVGLRRDSARFIGSLDADGYAIGGLSLGEAKDLTWELTAIVTGELPPARPRYLMGVGGPDDLVDGVANGVDLFDSVLPTRIARHGAVWTRDGRINLRNRNFATDTGPIDPGCPCPACRGFSRGWIRALYLAGDPLGMRLATLHNLTFLFQLMAGVRESIEAGDFASFRSAWLTRFRAEP
jgi:queuine tRNA-ribosyltransferase